MSMYKLIRRISNSFFPRPDRPWSEDATSTAPQIGKKRRMSTDEQDERESTPAKKARAGSEEQESQRERGSSPAARTDTEEVKEVTQGVRDVELDDERSTPAASADEGQDSVGGEGGEGKEVEEAGDSTVASDAAAVPLPESPTLHAAEPEDQDAEGEIDVEGKEAEQPTPADAVSKEESSTTSVAVVPAAVDEVPGLTMEAAHPKVEETAIAAAAAA